MSLPMYVYGALLVLVAMLLLVVPMLKHRSDSGVSLGLSALIVAFPAVVIAIYLGVSSYDWDAASNPKANTAPDVNAMVEGLAARMNAEPNLEGMTMLARSYGQLGRYGDAADTWHKAWNLTEGQDPLITLNYAEALVLADQRTLLTSAADLLESVLLVMPDDSRALWYGGMSAAAQGRDDVAAARWSKLLRADLPENMRTVVQQQMAELSLDESTRAGIAAVSAAGMEMAMVTVSIDIAPELAGQAEKNLLMFLIARDRDQPSPPVAVKRVRVGDFPVSIKISDSDAMVPGRNIKTTNNLELVARISKSGEAFAADGDLYGETLDVSGEASSQQARIRIDRIVGQD